MAFYSTLSRAPPFALIVRGKRNGFPMGRSTYDQIALNGGGPVGLLTNQMARGYVSIANANANNLG
jgi:hypothetical protein